MDNNKQRSNSRTSNEETNMNANSQNTINNDSKRDSSEQIFQKSVKKYSNSSIQQVQELNDKSEQNHQNDISGQQTKVIPQNQKYVKFSNHKVKNQNNQVGEVQKINQLQYPSEENNTNEFNSMRKSEKQNTGSFNSQKRQGSIKDNETKDFDLINSSQSQGQNGNYSKQSVDKFEKISQPKYSIDSSQKDDEFRDTDNKYKKQSIDSNSQQNIQIQKQASQTNKQNVDGNDKSNNHSKENQLENSSKRNSNSGIQDYSTYQQKQSQESKTKKEVEQKQQIKQNNNDEKQQNQYKKQSSDIDISQNQTKEQSSNRVSFFKNDLLYQDSINYKKSLKEKDIILGQMKQFTNQLQMALEGDQDQVIGLKNENKSLITQLRDFINHDQLQPDDLLENKVGDEGSSNLGTIEEQPQKQNSQVSNQEREQQANNKSIEEQFKQKNSQENMPKQEWEEQQMENKQKKSKENIPQQEQQMENKQKNSQESTPKQEQEEQQIENKQKIQLLNQHSSQENQQEDTLSSKKQIEIQIDESDRQEQEMDMYMSIDNKYQSAPREEKELKSHYEDKNDIFSEQDQTVDATKTRINETKSSSNILRQDQNEEELNKQVDNLDEIILQLRQNNTQLEEENQSLIKQSHLINSETKDLKYLLNNEIEILSIHNRTQLLQSQNQQPQVYSEYSSKIHELNYKLEVMKQKNEKLTRSNFEQLEDIQALIKENTLLNTKIDTLTKQLEAKDQEQFQKFEQFKFDLTKDYESRLNLKIQDIHYKSNQQIERYKQLLTEQQQQQNQFLNVLNNQSQLMASNVFNQNTQFNQQPLNNSQLNGTYMNNNNMNNYQENNFLNDPSNIYSQQQLNNTYSLNNTNQNFHTWNQTQQIRQPISRSSSEQNLAEKRIVWEICGVLRQKQIETLPKIIADINDLNQNLTKFSDCIIQLALSCHPNGYFGNQLPNLKQCWRWIKQILDEYMQLKSQTSNNDFEQQICSILQVNNQMDAISTAKEKLIQCKIAARAFNKVSNILNIKQFDTFAEFEQAIEQFDKEDMEIPKKLE